MCCFLIREGSKVHPAQESPKEPQEVELTAVRVIAPRRNSVYVGTPPLSARSLSRTTEGSMSYSDLYRKGDIDLRSPMTESCAKYGTKEHTEDAG
jgi:hypothetical protein